MKKLVRDTSKGIQESDLTLRAMTKSVGALAIITTHALSNPILLAVDYKTNLVKLHTAPSCLMLSIF